MALKFSYNMSDADIEQGILSIGQTTMELRNSVHCVAVSILARWVESGDAKTAAARATNLVEFVDGYAQQALVDWFSVHVKFEWDEEVECFTYTQTTIDMATAVAAKGKPYWAVKPPKKPQKTFDLTALLSSLIDKAEKKREKGLKEGENCPREMLDALHEIKDKFFVGK